MTSKVWHKLVNLRSVWGTRITPADSISPHYRASVRPADSIGPHYRASVRPADSIGPHYRASVRPADSIGPHYRASVRPADSIGPHYRASVRPADSIGPHYRASVRPADSIGPHYRASVRPADSIGPHYRASVRPADSIGPHYRASVRPADSIGPHYRASVRPADSISSQHQWLAGTKTVQPHQPLWFPVDRTKCACYTAHRLISSHGANFARYLPSLQRVTHRTSLHRYYVTHRGGDSKASPPTNREERDSSQVSQCVLVAHERYYRPSMTDNRYVAGYAKLGTSSCKKCKTKIEKGALRVGKVVSNPFGDDGGDMKQWFHPSCIFDTFLRARAATKKIEEPDDVEGFGDLRQEDKDVLNQLIDDFQSKSNTTPKKKKPPARSNLPISPPKGTPSPQKAPDDDEPSTSAAGAENADDPNVEKDNSFRQFRRLCADLAEENSYTGKTQLVHTYITKGHSGAGYQGDLYLLLKLLLPGVVKTVYNLNNKQLVKLFSQIFGTDLQEMVTDLDQGDVAETVRVAFDNSRLLMPSKKSALSLQEVDSLLTKLSQFTKEEDQQRVLTKIAVKCTANDLKMVVRLIKHDLRINAGAKHILDGLDPNAYAAFQASRDLKDVVQRVMANRREARDVGRPGLRKALSVKASLMTPVLPMLAEACKSVDYALKKCPNGIYAEIKYDGERVQVHKKGSDFRYFSRSLKPVLAHKVAHFKEYIPQAFPTGNDLILDAEVLLVDTNTGNPLPFGTLGVHKKAAFTDAKVCLYVFDCLLINDDNLMEKSMKERRQILEKNMKQVEHRINLSEVHKVKKGEDLQKLMHKVFDEGLEGLVLKDASGVYEPGKRHWLKVKKDYLHEGSMADSADLIVLGAYYGTGNKGGLMSIFLMGCYDPVSQKFVTVSKCGNGLDDKTLDRLQTELSMVKISKDLRKVPSWLTINKQVVPDFVVSDPKSSPVWEIIGAEFSRAEIHTADGISIRFPRIQKMRDDKTWKEATDLPRLQTLYRESKRTSDLDTGPSTSRKRGHDDNDDDNNDNDDSGSDSEGPLNGTSGSASASPRKGVKRGASDATPPHTSPAKKSKPACRFGADCYQTSQAHRDKFYHPPQSPGKAAAVASPTKGSPSAKPSSSSSDKKLPNTFQGCRIVLPAGVQDFQQLKRYILAFDGDLLPDYDTHTATHIVAASMAQVKQRGKDAQVVRPQWLWKCIRAGRLVSPDQYRPT